jgi:hypothetical protein
MLKRFSTFILVLLFLFCLFYLLPGSSWQSFAYPAESHNCLNPEYKYEWDGQQCWLITYCDGVAISKIPAEDGICGH